MIHPSLHLATAYLLATFFGCDPQPGPAVHFKYVDNPPRFSSEMPSRELRRLAPATPGIRPSDFPVTNGITQGTVNVQKDIVFKWQEQVFGGFCLYPGEVDVTVTYDALVHIAREYAASSCRYAETRKHELRHVAADEEVLKQQLPGIKKTAEAWAARVSSPGPYNKSQLETVQQLMSDKLQQGLETNLNRIERARAERQAQIDTREEYLRMSHTCPGEPLPVER